MQMRSYYKPLNDVADMIELLLECHPQGFDVLLGDVEPPTPELIHAMMDARRAKDPTGVPPSSPSHTTEAERIVWDADAFNAAVKTAHGWEHITTVCQDYKEAAPRLWSVVMDHVRFVSTSTTRNMSRLGYVATRHGLAPNTVMKYRREFPSMLAHALLVTTSDDDDFHLLPG